MTHTVDGSEIPRPTTVWMYKNPVKNGRFSQPQLVFTPDLPFFRTAGLLSSPNWNLGGEPRQPTVGTPNFPKRLRVFSGCSNETPICEEGWKQRKLFKNSRVFGRWKGLSVGNSLEEVDFFLEVGGERGEKKGGHRKSRGLSPPPAGRFWEITNLWVLLVKNYEKRTWNPPLKLNILLDLKTRNSWKRRSRIWKPSWLQVSWSTFRGVSSIKNSTRPSWNKNLCDSLRS